MSDPKHAAHPAPTGPSAHAACSTHAHASHAAPAGGACCAPTSSRPAPGLDALLEVLPFPAYTIDATDHVVSMNSAAKALMGPGTGALAGPICPDVFHCQMCAGACAAQDARQTGEISASSRTCTRRTRRASASASTPRRSRTASSPS
jgi:hypothetical protein